VVFCHSGGRRRVGRLAALALAGSVICLTLPACSAPQPTSKELAVSRIGGVLHVAPGVSLRVGRGSAPGTKVRVSVAPVTPAFPYGAATRLGPAVVISPDRHLATSTIRFTINPAGLPKARPGQRPPTIGNAFIAVLNEPTQTWLPLPTTYDPATRQLTAVAPHFSTFTDWVTKPGKVLLHVGSAAVSVVVKAGETGLAVAEAEAEAAWNSVQPGFGGGIRRTLPADERIDTACAGNDPVQVADQRYQTAGGGELRSCVVDPRAEKSAPALLLENDFGFPVDLFPQAGAKLPALTISAHPDQDALAALASLAGHGYIPGPGVTRIGFPSPPPMSFTVQAQADWLGLVTEVLDAAAAIIPDTEVAQTNFATAADKVAADAAQAGQQAVPTAQALQKVDTELKVEKGQAFETAEAFTSAYSCLAGLSASVESASLTKLADQIRDCLKDIFPGATSDATDYLKALIGFIQLPAVLNDFREHGRQVYTITAVRAPADGTYEGLLRKVDPQTGSVEFEQVEMLVGAAARPACHAHHIPDSAPCAFFIEDLHVASTGVLAANAQIKSQLSPDGVSISAAGYPLTPAQLVPLTQPTAIYSDTPFRIIVQHGQIISMLGLYHP
jgi:hypothetical protein